MKKCTNCDSLQDNGKFCAKCGSETMNVEVENTAKEEQDRAANIQAQSEPALETAAHAPHNINASHQEGAAATEAQINNAQTSSIDVKEVSMEYWNYFLRLFKNPTEALRHTENEFINGIINIILYTVTFAIGIYYTITALDKVSMGSLAYILGNEQNIPFFPVFIRVAMIAIIALACTLICITLIEKIFVKQMTFKQQVTQYAGILTPFIAVNLLTVLTGLAGAFGMAISLALLSLFTATIIYSILFIYDKVTLYRSSPHKVYAAIVVYVANLLLIYILIRMFVVQKLGELEDILYSF